MQPARKALPELQKKVVLNPIGERKNIVDPLLGPKTSTGLNPVVERKNISDPLLGPKTLTSLNSIVEQKKILKPLSEPKISTGLTNPIVQRKNVLLDPLEEPKTSISLDPITERKNVLDPLSRPKSSPDLNPIVKRKAQLDPLEEPKTSTGLQKTLNPPSVISDTLDDLQEAESQLLSISTGSDSHYSSSNDVKQRTENSTQENNENFESIDVFLNDNDKIIADPSPKPTAVGLEESLDSDEISSQSRRLSLSTIPEQDYSDYKSLSLKSDNFLSNVSSAKSLVYDAQSIPSALKLVSEKKIKREFISSKLKLTLQNEAVDKKDSLDSLGKDILTESSQTEEISRKSEASSISLDSNEKLLNELSEKVIHTSPKETVIAPERDHSLLSLILSDTKDEDHLSGTSQKKVIPPKSETSLISLDLNKEFLTELSEKVINASQTETVSAPEHDSLLSLILSDKYDEDYLSEAPQKIILSSKSKTSSQSLDANEKLLNKQCEKIIDSAIKVESEKKNDIDRDLSNASSEKKTGSRKLSFSSLPSVVSSNKHSFSNEDEVGILKLELPSDDELWQRANHEPLPDQKNLSKEKEVEVKGKDIQPPLYRQTMKDTEPSGLLKKDLSNRRKKSISEITVEEDAKLAELKMKQKIQFERLREKLNDDYPHKDSLAKITAMTKEFEKNLQSSLQEQIDELLQLQERELNALREVHYRRMHALSTEQDEQYNSRIKRLKTDCSSTPERTYQNDQTIDDINNFAIRNKSQTPDDKTVDLELPKSTVAGFDSVIQELINKRLNLDNQIAALQRKSKRLGNLSLPRENDFPSSYVEMADRKSRHTIGRLSEIAWERDTDDLADAKFFLEHYRRTMERWATKSTSPYRGGFLRERFDPQADIKKMLDRYGAEAARNAMYDVDLARERLNRYPSPFRSSVLPRGIDPLFGVPDLPTSSHYVKNLDTSVFEKLVTYLESIGDKLDRVLELIAHKPTFVGMDFSRPQQSYNFRNTLSNIVEYEFARHWWYYGGWKKPISMQNFKYISGRDLMEENASLRYENSLLHSPYIK